ncbi:MAG: dihydroxy-acid dehydratase, partial [Acidobacteria bacterium]
ISDCEWSEIEDGIARSPGHCMTMGTASTMTSLAETLGMTLPGASSIPAVDANHSRMASACGRRIVEMVWEDLKPSDILTPASFENAITADMAIGGSTNAIIHLVALAGRAGIKLDLKTFDDISQRTPMIANLRPSGEYLMEDFYYAGGLRALLKEISELLSLDSLTVAGNSLGANLASARICKPEVIRSVDNPVSQKGGTAILYGNLAPNGAVIKPTAAEPRLLQHVGPAVVFKNHQDMMLHVDNEDLPVDENSVLVLQNAGPLGGPGMPEWGMLPIPKKLLQKGVRDMVRISDARMSGTSYGACVLHVAPESFVGGPLALVRDGDLIELDVAGRRLDLRVGNDELANRRAQWNPEPPRYERGFGALYAAHVTQADQGCDFDFLHAGAATSEPEIH